MHDESVALEMRQILLAKQLLAEAETVLSRDTHLAHGLSVLLAQDSAEMLLGAVAKAWSLQLTKKAGFEELVGNINAAALERLQRPLPHSQRLLELNRARVSFKHHGQAPRADDSRRYVSYASEFLYAACVQLLNIDAATLSLSDLVRDEKVREQLKIAESAFREEDFEAARRAAALAVYYVNKELDSFFPQVKAAGSLRGEVSSEVSQLTNYVNALRMAVLISQLGIDQRLYWAFIAHTPVVGIAPLSGQIHFSSQRAGFPASRDQAELCVGFARDLAIAAQEKLGGLSSPRVQ